MQWVEQAAEATRHQLATRALSDVGRIRGLVVGLLDRGEAEATEAASRAKDAISYLRLVEGEPAIFESCAAPFPCSFPLFRALRPFGLPLPGVMRQRLRKLHEERRTQFLS
jgi:hypothetical protein